MRRRALLFVAFLALAGCDEGAPIPNADLLLRISVGADRVVPGRAFPVTVVRVWDKDLVPAPFDDHALAPLALRLESTARREDARHVEETRRYRGYAFSTTDVSVRPPVWTAKPKDGGPPRKTTGDPVRLRVDPEVDPKDPGEPEGPGEPLETPRSRTPLVALALALALVAIVAFVVAQRRRTRAVVPPDRPTPRPDPAARALDRLRALSGTSDAAAIAAVVRDLLSESLDVPALRRTTPEILAIGTARGVFVPETRSALAAALSLSDLAKFAGREPTRAEFDAALREAARFVRGVTR